MTTAEMACLPKQCMSNVFESSGKPSLTIIRIVCSGVPPFSIVSARFSIVSAPFSMVSPGFRSFRRGFRSSRHRFRSENGAETKHLNSTRTARPPKGPGSSNQLQKLKSNITLRREPVGANCHRSSIFNLFEISAATATPQCRIQN